MRLLWTLLTAALAPLGGPLPPGDPGREAGEETVRRFRFESPGDLEGFQAGRGIAGLEVSGGKLTGRLTESDAYLFLPPVKTPIEGLVVRVRWSCPRAGQAQCYFSTEASPAMGEDKVVSREAPGGKLIETEFELDEPARARGGGSGAVLTRLRLDPFNGNTGVPFEIEEVTLVRLPARFEAGLAPVKSAVLPGEKVAFRIWARHLGGRALPVLEARLEHPGDAGRLLVLEPAPGGAEASFSLSFPEPGIPLVRARLTAAGRTTHVLEARIAVGLGREPGKPLLEREGAAIELLREGPGSSLYAAARFWARDGQRWRDAGLILPLVETVVEEEGEVRRRVPALELESAERGRFRLSLPAGEGLRPSLEFEFQPDRNPQAGSPRREPILARAALEAPSGTRLLRFAGPAVRRLSEADPPARYGLFGGIEFLEPGQRSSSERAVGPRFAERSTPSALKVSLPVMAIEEDGVTTALLWDPLQSWAPGRTLLAATFASPDRLEGQRGHRMVLSVPPPGELRDENEELARRPFVLDGKPLSVSFAVDLACGERVAAAARRWYAHFGLPDPPPAPHSPSETYDLLARCLGETVYWPEEKGWRQHWFLDRSSAHRPDFAAELILHAKVTGERRWVAAASLDPARPVIDTAGTLWDRAAGGRGAAQAALRSMRPDGSYGYHDSAQVKEETRRVTGGLFDTLGEEGSTSLGTCVQGALPLLRHLLLTGDPELLAPARRALDALRRFRVPRGAQVWEVHQEIPDIRASALAVEALRIGYLVTGDASYLDEAFYWAETGLPFLYSWRAPDGSGERLVVRTSADRADPSKSRAHPAADLFQEPRRQATPFGTIPVFGSSYYVASWFGVIVEWCGLEWAAKVLELCELREDPLLQAAARGVVRSGLQQMFDREPWIGLYPDVWNLEERWAGGALIAPRLLIDGLRGSGQIPQPLRIWSRRVEAAGEGLLVHGWGEPLRCQGDPTGLRVVFRFLPGERWELLIARSPRPLSVGTHFPTEAGDGFRYDAKRRLLGIRSISPTAEVEVRIGYR